MGAVYEARDLVLGRSVAVKIMLGEAFGQPHALRRFRREAQAAARLNHPNVVSVYDFGPLEGQGAYLVMERVSGATLRTTLVRAGVLAPPVAGSWFDPLLAGLAAAHAQGVIHRDLKPENVIGCADGAGSLLVKILDFGLAKLDAVPTAASGTLTAEGMVLGTLGYMSPEQRARGEVDHRTDIFAVGVMLAEALTGWRPFDHEAREPVPGPLSRDLPPALHSLLQRCLARDPDDRYESVAQLRSDLVPALLGSQPPPRPGA